MTLNHINLTVTDAQEARRFFEKYFGMQSMDGTTDTATFLALRDEMGFTLTLMQSAKPFQYPPAFHIGFLGWGDEKTFALYQQLVADGYNAQPPGHYRKNEFYFATPFGVTVQVS